MLRCPEAVLPFCCSCRSSLAAALLCAHRGSTPGAALGKSFCFCAKSGGSARSDNIDADQDSLPFQESCWALLWQSLCASWDVSLSSAETKSSLKDPSIYLVGDNFHGGWRRMQCFQYQCQVTFLRLSSVWVLKSWEQEAAMHSYWLSLTQDGATQQAFSFSCFSLVWTFPACLCKADVV